MASSPICSQVASVSTDLDWGRRCWPPQQNCMLAAGKRQSDLPEVVADGCVRIEKRQDRHLYVS